VRTSRTLWRVRRLRGLQRLLGRRLQGLHRLRGLLRVRLRLLPFVGRLPVHLLIASSSPLVSNARGHQIIASFTAALLVCIDGQSCRWRLHQGSRRMLDRSQCVRYGKPPSSAETLA